MTLAKGTPDIIRGSDQMFTTLYEGNGGGQKVGKFVPFTDNGTIAKSLIINDGDDERIIQEYCSRLKSADYEKRKRRDRSKKVFFWVDEFFALLSDVTLSPLSHPE